MKNKKAKKDLTKAKTKARKYKFKRPRRVGCHFFAGAWGH